MQLEISAHHEAGHIIMTYLNGYRCKGFYLKGDGDGASALDFGTDKELVSAIFTSLDDGNTFNSLPKTVKIKTPQVAGKVIEIILGGPVAESIFTKGMGVNSTNSVEVTGEDAKNADAVEHILRSLQIINDLPLLDSEIQRTYEIFVKSPEIQNAVNKLANEVLANQDHMLSQEELESVLDDIGFLDYVKDIQQ